MIAGSPYLKPAPRQLYHCMGARHIAAGDHVAMPVNDRGAAPLVGREAFRRGVVLCAMNGNALVKLDTDFRWQRLDRLTLLPRESGRREG